MRRKNIRSSSNIMNNQISITTTILFHISLILFASYGTEAFIGMNWGRHSAQRLVPSLVVDLLLQNGIGNARIATSEEDILKAFVDSGINLTVAVFKDSQLADISFARAWVQQRSKYIVRSNIRQVIIGNYPFVRGRNDSSIIVKAMASMNTLQDAFYEAGYENITANMVHYLDVLKPNIMKPSDAEFPDEIKYRIALFIEHLRGHNASFLIEMFPILETTLKKFNLNFAFIDNNSPRYFVKDVNGAVYHNMFEFTYDSFVWALNKMNASDIKVTVIQVGWPTDGCYGATTGNAERFFKYLLPFVTSDQGTPMRPGAPIDTYVHALTDETRMPYQVPFARHWGVYRSNGQPKYRINLSGRGRNIYPSTIEAIMRMPKRWCVFNGDNTDIYLVESQLNDACMKGDCSSTTPGGSCSGLSFEQNVSYAFNMLFQFEFQSETSCNFGGLGRVSVRDPSTRDCVFPIEVVRGEQINFVKT